VIDERQAEFGRGDFLIRDVLGADPKTGAVAVGDEVEVGATVQLQVRDADSADEDLRDLLWSRTADGALLFTCNGRGTSLFGIESHDARLVSDALDRAPLAGMSCAGELGPVGGRSFLHTFTASLLLLHDR
jgi:small ligand-binding sensory domain FIST